MVRPLSFITRLFCRGLRYGTSDFPLQLARATRQLTFPHLLLSGPPEMGKRTLALALAQEVGVTIRSCDPAVLGRTDLAAVLTNLDRGDFFLIEEIESLNKEIFKFLLQAIEDWQLDLIVGKGASRRSITLDLKAFTLIGTTSKPAQVDKRLRRWLVVLNFAPYDVNQLGELILRLAKQESVIILPDAASLLAEYCDGSVGNARVLVKRVRDYSRDLIAVTPEVAREALVSFGYLD